MRHDRSHRGLLAFHDGQDSSGLRGRQCSVHSVVGTLFLLTITSFLVLPSEVLSFSPSFGIADRVTTSRTAALSFLGRYPRHHFRQSLSDDDESYNDQEDYFGEAHIPGDEYQGAFLSKDQLEAMTVAQLKQQLRLRGLRVGGKKQELCDRLAQHYKTFSASMEAQVAADRQFESENPSIVDAEIVGKDDPSSSKAWQFAKDHGKELVDVSEYLDEDDKGEETRTIKSEGDGNDDDDESAPVSTEGDEGAEQVEANPPTRSAETWGSKAKIVDDYEGRTVVLDGLSRLVVDYLGSNQTMNAAYVVASRDALKRFLAGGLSQTNVTASAAEDRLREVQLKREQAAKIPMQDEYTDGPDTGDEKGYYKDVIHRDYSDWGKYTQTGAQMSAQEVQGVLLLSDVYGPFTNDTRALADKIAFECQPIVVMVPDLFRGKPWEETTPGLNAEGQDYETWRAQHDDLRVNVDIRAAAACLREQYAVNSVVVWGTCYGGGRALEAAAGYVPDNRVHDVDGLVGPPPVDPMVAIAWYPTRYSAKTLFGKERTVPPIPKKIDPITKKEQKVKMSVMAVFAERDDLPGATSKDAALLQDLLKEDERVHDEMVKVFPGQRHGFAHIGISAEKEADDTERFVDNEFGGSGRIGTFDGDAEVACLLSTAFMESYSRVFLPTVGPAIGDDEDWSALMMKDLAYSETRDVRAEIEDQIENFKPPEDENEFQYDLESEEDRKKIIDIITEGYREEMMGGPNEILDTDDLNTVIEKLLDHDVNFQLH